MLPTCLPQQPVAQLPEPRGTVRGRAVRHSPRTFVPAASLWVQDPDGDTAELRWYPQDSL
jgi:hypothetical protein